MWKFGEFSPPQANQTHPSCPKRYFGTSKIVWQIGMVRQVLDMAGFRRIERANELLREIIGDFILHKMRDPRLQLVTITEVQVSSDFKHGKVFFSVLGSEQQEAEALNALQSAEPLFREEINRNVHWRFIPRLTFIVDKRIEKATQVLALLDQIAQSQKAKETAPTAPSKPTRQRKRVKR